MIGRGSRHRDGAHRHVRASFSALLFALSIGVASAYADDISGEYADDAPEEYTDDAPEEYADDAPDDEYADDAPEEYGDDADEDVDEDPGPGFGRIAWDVTLLRPLGFIRLIAGGVITVPVSLLALPAGVDNVESMADYFVGQPYRDTFKTPLGEF